MVWTQRKDRDVPLEVEGGITTMDSPAAGSGDRSKVLHAWYGNGITLALPFTGSNNPSSNQPAC